jgi:hypothetical protein
MDFDDFMRGFGGDFFEQSPEGADWMQTHEHLTPIIRHLVAGVEGGHISAGQMIDGCTPWPTRTSPRRHST